ncbi:peroxiredoxin [Panacagrimonas perspica]|uniref:Peroxiredoxin n=1 Tax=Panacagrimonas perspica TaxID=381431 RepID=A0A4R7NZA9_9GAMM|nr:thioredoxin family protein [Panacagrimonas perspica]TDU26683.1 peroxiredoxin [Panacagrimonas perspica]THD04031.1 thioredoxin family protein [Panacagrimonas perspica]
MSLTPSTMLPLGTVAPDFGLPDVVSGSTLALADVRGRTGTLVMFICNHCPYVLHVNAELVRVAQAAQSRGVGVVAISSNDVRAYPADAPERMTEVAREQGYPFPYLYDATQSVARAYDAACTPDFFLFDAESKLVYRGRLDDSTPGNGRPLTGADLRAALDALRAGAAPLDDQKPSMGCNIKWSAPR